MSDEKKPVVEMVLGKSKEQLVRGSYLNVFKPKLNSQSNKMECSAQFLIPKTSPEAKEIKDAIASLKQQVWTAKKKPVPPLWWNPLRDGDTDVKQNGKPYGAEAKGMYVLAAKTGNDQEGNVVIPEVVGPVKDADGKFVRLSSGEIKSGDYVRAKIRLVPYEKGTGGVGVYFNLLQKTKTGDALGNGSQSAEDAFDEFDADEEDPLG
ncbi:MAG TPA: ssDNA-binding protein [Aquabacterium sp.]|nr:ssDNA-binding protein [Aquabacterium sp.]